MLGLRERGGCWRQILVVSSSLPWWSMVVENWIEKNNFLLEIIRCIQNVSKIPVETAKTKQVFVKQPAINIKTFNRRAIYNHPTHSYHLDKLRSFCTLSFVGFRNTFLKRFKFANLGRWKKVWIEQTYLGHSLSTGSIFPQWLDASLDGWDTWGRHWHHRVGICTGNNNMKMCEMPFSKQQLRQL